MTLAQLLRLQNTELHKAAADEIDRLESALIVIKPFADFMLSKMIEQRDPTPLKKALKAVEATLKSAQRDWTPSQ